MMIRFSICCWLHTSDARGFKLSGLGPARVLLFGAPWFGVRFGSGFCLFQTSGSGFTLSGFGLFQIYPRKRHILGKNLKVFNCSCMSEWAGLGTSDVVKDPKPRNPRGTTSTFKSPTRTRPRKLIPEQNPKPDIQTPKPRKFWTCT